MANTTFDPSMLNATMSVNADADAYSDQKPPAAGVYLVLLAGPKKADDFYQHKMAKDAQGKETSFSHVSFRVHGVIVDPDGPYDGLAVFPHVFQTPTTKLSERSGTTTVLSLIKRLGFGHLMTKQEYSHLEQIEMFRQVLASKPQIRVRVEWRLPGKKKPDGTYDPDTLTKYDDFPDDDKGGKQWQFPADPLNPNGEKVSARAEIVEWLGSPLE